MNDSIAPLIRIAALLLLALVVTSIVLTLRFVAADARLRGKSPAAIVSMVFFLFPLGLVIWLFTRPAPVPPRKPTL